MTTFTVLLALLSAWVYSTIFRRTSLDKVPSAHWSSAYSSALIFWKRYTESANAFIHQAHLQHGPIVRIGPEEISVNSLEGLKTIYAGGWEKHEFYSVFTNYDGVRNLFTFLDSANHSQRKRFLSNVYSKSYLLSCSSVPRIVRQIIYRGGLTKLSKASHHNDPVDVNLFLSCLTMDTMSAYIFGLQDGTSFLENPEQYLMFLDNYTRRGAHAILKQELPTLARFAKRLGLVDGSSTRFAKESVDRFCLDMYIKACDRLNHGEMVEDEAIVFKQVKAAAETSAAKSGRLLDSIETRKEVASELLDHLLAGFETSAIALTYAIFWLSTKPSIRSELHAELLSLSQISDRALDALPVLNAIVMETLRLNAPIPGSQPRVAPSGSTLTLHGFGPFPGGTRISTQAHSLHRNPEVFPQPDEWQPRRWLPTDGEGCAEGTVKYQAHDLAERRRWFWAFGSGGRMCIGSNFAILIIKATLAAIYTDFETEVVDGTEWEQLDGYTVGPRGKITIRFKDLGVSKDYDLSC